MLVVRRNDPLVPSTELIIIPRSVLDGLITALHIKLDHPSRHQLELVMKCHFYALDLPKVSKGAKIRNRYNQVPHLTQDTNGKVTNSQKTPQTRAKRSALSQQVTTKHI